jgi:3-dehydroquinate dehydratase-2
MSLDLERPGTIRLLVLSGPNLGRLGRREPSIYGSETLEQIEGRVRAAAEGRDAQVEFGQSDHEGELVARIGGAGDAGFSGIVLNAGAYTHTSIAILDAIRASGLPVVEVHLSNPEAREGFRRRSRIASACVAKVSGFGGGSYVLGTLGLIDYLRQRGGGPA